MPAGHTLSCLQGFYAFALQELGLQGKPDVWKEYQASQEPLGSVGLYDPRWHPEVVIRGRKLGKSHQDVVDYWVSFLPSHACIQGRRFVQAFLFN